MILEEFFQNQKSPSEDTLPSKEDIIALLKLLPRTTLLSVQ
jgi:hypothetical protein